MMPRKKRKTLIIITSVILILAITTTLVILYLNTDLFKSNETLFFKYIGKNIQNINDIESSLETSEFDNLLETSKYTENSEIKINYTKNIGTTSEDSSNAINKLKLEINGQTDKTDKYDYKDIKLLNDNEQELEIEYMQSENNYGIKFSKLFKQYIMVENSNLKELLKNMGYSEEDLENVPDSIELKKDMFGDIKFSQEELQKLRDKYQKVIEQKLSKQQFEKKTKETITINQEDIIVNSYIVKLTKEQLNGVYIAILENLKEDEIILQKIDNVQKSLEETKLVTSGTLQMKEKVIKSIEKAINNISNNNIGNDETQIIVYESGGDTVRTTIQGVNYEFNIDYLPIDNNKFAEITFKKKQEEIKKLTIDKKDGEIEISIVDNENNVPLKIDFAQTVNSQNNNYVKNMEIKYENDNVKLETIINQNINIVDNFNEQITINNENAIILNKLDENQLKSILNKVYETVGNQFSSVIEKIGVQDIENVLKDIGIIQDRQKLEGNGISDIEKNRYNSKFEILKGEDIDSENMLEIINMIKENINNIEVVSNEQVKIKVDQNENKEELGKKLEDFIQKNKERKYNVDVEYNQETGLVESLIMTIIKEK